MQEIIKTLKRAAKDLFNVDIEPDLTRPEEQFGDYTSNIAMQLAGKLNKNEPSLKLRPTSPREIAVALASKLHGQEGIKEVNIAGPGFINLKLSDETLFKNLDKEPAKAYVGQEILVEFGDPNPFKEMHIGHLYSYLVGDALSNLLEASGAKVQRLSYHGDVGLHVAKAIYGMQQLDKGREGRPLENIRGENWQAFIDLGEAYAEGAQAYGHDERAKEKINEINQHIYAGDNPEVNRFYKEGKNRSFEYFDKILAEIKVKTTKRYLESQTTPEGIEFVKQNIGKVFEESDGAVVYRGEKVGLHTRVFITSKGLPTYEAKDLGLAELKNKDYPDAAKSIIITAHEQSEYFKVMLAALKEFDEELANKTTHLAHGFLSLSTGKMSSRTGEVYGAVNLLDDVAQEQKKKYPDSPEGTDLAAIKYGFLKHRLGTDIIYDVKESVSLEGNSGPYLQYAHARAKSILAKAAENSPLSTLTSPLELGERSLARKLSEYPEVIEKATKELMPHHIATYLYELAQVFNRFYEKSRVIGDERQNIRLKLVSSYADVLKNGLGLLGIDAPDKM
jgi:arginyl-tRNA synthetase